MRQGACFARMIFPIVASSSAVQLSGNVLPAVGVPRASFTFSALWETGPRLGPQTSSSIWYEPGPFTPTGWQSSSAGRAWLAQATIPLGYPRHMLQTEVLLPPVLGGQAWAISDPRACGAGRIRLSCPHLHFSS